MRTRAKWVFVESERLRWRLMKSDESMNEQKAFERQRKRRRVLTGRRWSMSLIMSFGTLDMVIRD